MNISSFDDLVLAARQQTQPQQLLFVFATAELPDDATPEQRAGFEQGVGGALVPATCVDKTLDDISDFSAIKREASQFVKNWCVLFASSLSGADTLPPAQEKIQSALDRMVEAIKLGAFANMIAFDDAGQAIALE
ncbi:ribonucleotide reductase subunit alpha [Rhodoferax sp.]|uniref:ribonucleotide reductase subunit alpha n=1 Tax=Rhodoferax sp. TaxID=50421 RepID=UPI0028433069|nr:ribonucleotide reductase subunit alpha [Rhodoferax sp.]MDR3370843.1 ribonucleotide reductase subunit alpha [Rhodoferax sp.]